MVILVAAILNPLTRPVPAGESAGTGHPLPQGGEGKVARRGGHLGFYILPSPPWGRGAGMRGSTAIAFPRKVFT